MLGSIQVADKKIQAIIEQVQMDIGVHGIRVLHRIGWLDVGEASIVITVSSPHRREAFTACQAVIDQIKSDVPIWKKESYVDGTSEWVMCQHHKPQEYMSVKDSTPVD